MTLMRRDPYDPFYEITQRMTQMMDRMRYLMNNPLMPWDGSLLQHGDANPLDIDMTSSDKDIIVRTALPGFKEDEVNVDVRDNVLTISAESKTHREDQHANWYIREMRYGKFARSVILPEAVSTDKADASLENGILTVRLPKQKPSPVRQIAVKARNLLLGGKKDSE